MDCHPGRAVNTSRYTQVVKHQKEDYLYTLVGHNHNFSILEFDFVLLLPKKLKILDFMYILSFNIHLWLQTSMYIVQSIFGYVKKTLVA